MWSVMNHLKVIGPPIVDQKHGQSYRIKSKIDMKHCVNLRTSRTIKDENWTDSLTNSTPSLFQRKEFLSFIPSNFEVNMYFYQILMSSRSKSSIGSILVNRSHVIRFSEMNKMNPVKALFLPESTNISLLNLHILCNWIDVAANTSVWSHFLVRFPFPATSQYFKSKTPAIDLDQKIPLVDTSFMISDPN